MYELNRPALSILRDARNAVQKEKAKELANAAEGEKKVAGLYEVLNQLAIKDEFGIWADLEHEPDTHALIFGKKKELIAIVKHQGSILHINFTERWANNSTQAKADTVEDALSQIATHYERLGKGVRGPA